MNKVVLAGTAVAIGIYTHQQMALKKIDEKIDATIAEEVKERERIRAENVLKWKTSLNGLDADIAARRMKANMQSISLFKERIRDVLNGLRIMM
jgi:hypothetical protein